ncbi:MAG: nucleotidyltransferase domain-containing protein [Candidatus Aenigmarchaeota archaeon]|nr:nucleotidyltransferase domain-containing protein [Candidatus Aenigmarchaeota archaeon]
MKTFSILASKKELKILNLFLENQKKEFYQSEIARKTRFSRTTIIKWVKTLEKKQMIIKIKKGMTYYKLNKENPLIKQLKIMKTISQLQEALKILKDEPIEIYLFGSCARGEDEKESDIDILIIGKSNKISWFIDSANKIAKKQVRPIVKTPLEYSDLARKDRLFYDNIEKNKIRLI